MKLTQRQERRVEAFLDACAERLANLPERARHNVMARTERYMNQRFDAFQTIPTDADVEGVLEEVEQALRSLNTQPETGRKQPVRLPAEYGEPDRDALWLGVCASSAERFGFDVRALRAVAVIVGVVTGPLAILIYMAAFLALYLEADGADFPEVDWYRFPLFALKTLAIAMAIHAGARAAMWCLDGAYAWLLASEAPELSDWEWLRHRGGEMLFWTIATALPLALLAGLPLAYGWSQTLRRVAGAIVALYALAVSGGLASYLTGIILQSVDAFSRMPVVPP